VAYRKTAKLALVGAFSLAASGIAFAAEEDSGSLTINGTVALGPSLCAGSDESGVAGAACDGEPVLRQEDRLILRIYHPKNGVQHDLTYKIIREFSLPRPFRINPNIDMNGNPRFSDYIVEAYTDRDGRAGDVGDGEYFATSGETVPLGTTQLQLVLGTR
jgi:hypothetical protein